MASKDKGSLAEDRNPSCFSIALSLLVIVLAAKAGGSIAVNVSQIYLTRRIMATLTDPQMAICESALPTRGAGLDTAAAGELPGMSVALALNPRSGPVEILLGREACLRRDWPEAERHFSVATLAWPAHISLQYALGNVLYLQGETDKAVMAWRSAGAEVKFVRKGMRSYAERNFEQALNYFNLAIQVAPEYADAYRGRGLVLVHVMGQLSEGLADLEQAKRLGLAERFPFLNVEIAHVKVMLGDNPGALDLLESINPKPAFAWMLYGDIYLRQGELESAIAAYQASLQGGPDNLFAYWGLGRTYWQMGQFLLACAQWQEALARDPQFGLAQEALQAAQRQGICP